MFFPCGLLLLSSLFSITQRVSAAFDFPAIVNTTSPLTLAIKPACGTLNSSIFTEINTGINLSATRYIYPSLSVPNTPSRN